MEISEEVSRQEDKITAEAFKEPAKEAATESVAEPTGKEKAGSIQDFGEKIAGAKKDLWASWKKRMQQRPSEGSDFTLSDVFPLPNWEAAIANGTDTDILALTKLLRDVIPAKPKTGGGDSVWKNRVLAIRDIVNMLMIGRVSAETAVKKIEGLNSAAAERFRLYKDLGYPAFLKAKDYRIDEVNYYSDPWIVRKGRKVVEKYPTYEEAVNALRDRLTNAENQRRETKFDIYQYRTTKEIVIGKKVGTGRYVDLKKGFKNWREAAEYINAHREELEEGLKRAKEVRESRGETNEERTGKQWREDISVSPEEFLKTFGFRGVQFGNYVGQDMRSKNLNEAYDALLDSSDVLNIPSQAISLDGTLGLAFGARGSGGKGAATAHRREMKEAFDNVVKAVKDSEMFTRSKRRDQARAAPYWSSEKEMTARAFETYVKDRLAEKGTKNDFLVNIIDTGTVIEESDYEYPAKRERIKIDEAFDRLFNTMQTEPTETGYRLYQEGFSER